jgi:hypothetical protein
MMNHKNPYSDLINMMQTQGAKYNSPSITLGRVINPLPNLIILIGDLQVDRDNLLVAEELGQHQRLGALAEAAATGFTDQTVISGYGGHSHNIRQVGYASGELTIEPCLNKDDLVAVIPMEGYQKYIVLCKVVSLGG